MEKSIRIRILNRDYPLIVGDADDEALTRRMAAYVNEKMQAFKKEHPEQSELTAAVITSLALAEELFVLREREEETLTDLDHTLNDLADRLEAALP